MSELKSNDYKYYAFISYSRKDIKDAKWIHSSLEKFHIPTKLPRAADAEPVPKPLRCFRDINDLDVMPESFIKGIESALGFSKYLVVVCSPNSAQSTADGNHYVDWEIQKFIEVHGAEYAKNHILPVIIDGKITHNTAENECLPPTLYKLGDDFLEHNFPILDYGDENTITKNAKNDFILKILAFLLQVKYSILNDRYQKAQRKRRHIVLGTAVALIAVFAVISVYALFGWRKARESLALSYYRQAHNLLESNDVSRALAYYNRSLKLDANPVVQDEVYSLITNGSWLVEKETVTELSKKDFSEKEICEKLSVRDVHNFYKIQGTKNGVLQKLSDDGRYAAILKPDNSFELIDVETETLLLQDYEKDGYVWRNGNTIGATLKCCFSGNNNIFAYEQEQKRESGSLEIGFVIKIFNLSTKTVSEIQRSNMLSHWAISPDGQFLVYSARIANDISELSVYDIQKKQTRWTRREEFPRTEIVFSPDNIHFATTGDLIFGDSSANKVQIHNCFHEYENIAASVKGSVEKIQFSNDGRRIAVSTSKNELNVLKTRDGSQLVKPRLLSNKILSLNFTDNDNSIRVGFKDAKPKEYEIRVNSMNFSILQTSLYAGNIRDTVLLNKNYVCNLCGNAIDGLFLEVRNLNDKNDFFLTKLNNDIQELGAQYFIKKSPLENTLFIGSGESTSKKDKGGVEIYSVNLKDKDYLSYKYQVEFPYPVTDIQPVSDKYAVVFSKKTYKDTEQNNLYLLDLSGDVPLVKEYNTGLCFAYTLNTKNELFTVNKNSDGECMLKKWDALNMKEKWSTVFETRKYFSDAIVRVDSNGKSYVASNQEKILAFDKKGRALREIEPENRITMLELSKDGSLMIIGTNPFIIGSDICDIEVRDTKTGEVRFKTDYEAETPVSITNAAFSEKADILHLAGCYRKEGNPGFYDVWDVNSQIKFDTSFSVEVDKIFDFDLLPDGTSLLYTSEGIVDKNAFTTDKEILPEMEEDSLYQLIGAWMLNKHDVPQAFEFETELKERGRVGNWLLASAATRTINPQSEKTIESELEDNSKRQTSREIVLDIQADNADALDSYYFDVIKSVVEKNFKKNKSINSWQEQLEIDNTWELNYSNNFWNMVLADEEALKLYKFHIDNYLSKVPDSPEPLNKLWMYYKRLGDAEQAKKIYDRMVKKYSDTVYIKLRLLNDNKELSLEEKKSIFRDMMRRNDNNAVYSFDELKDMLNYYKNNLALDSSFDEIKETVGWFLEGFKMYLLQDTSKYANKFSSILYDIGNMVQFHKGGFGFYLQCIDYLYEGVSETVKILLRLEPQKQAVSMMNSIVNNDNEYIQNLIGDTDFTDVSFEQIVKNPSLIENGYMYYAQTDNPKKDILLGKMLDVDRMFSYEHFSSMILTDLRIYKKLGKTNILSDDDSQKVFSLALELMLKRLRNGNSAGIEIQEIISDGQAEKAGLKKGDILLFYDNYPLSTETGIYNFFIYDLHTSEQQKNNGQVEIIALRGGKMLRFVVQEGLLGIQF